MALTIAAAQLAGVFVESLAYGVYLMVFVQCITALRKWTSKPSFYLLGTTISLFIFATVHLAIDILRTTRAFTSNAPNYPMQYYSRFNTWDTIFKSGIYVAITVISDAFLLYRCFIIWGRSYFVIIVPFLLFLVGIVAGILCTYTLTLVHPMENVFVDALSIRVKIFCVATLAMNVVCTTLIAYKIWTIPGAFAPFADDEKYLRRAVTIIVESCAIYSTMLVVIIITGSTGSPVMFIFVNGVCPIIGIVFSSVIIRVGTGVSHGDTHHSKQLSSAPQLPQGGAQVLFRQTVHTHIDGFLDCEVEMGDASVESENFASKTFNRV